MPSSNFLNDSLSQDVGADEFLSTVLEPTGADATPGNYTIQEGEIDYRIRQLSYSSLLTLHSCPRQFQLDKLRATRKEEEFTASITFAFGHVVGQAIQDALSLCTEDEIIWKIFLGWEVDLLAEDVKRNKSIWQAILAAQRFLVYRTEGELGEYNLVEFRGKPACELSFAINFPNDFRFRGFVDAVLVHQSTGEILVLELKTTGAAAVDPASYQNSAQAIGYSIVLDSIYPELSSYHVLYLVYSTKTGEFAPMRFTKSFSQRAAWIRQLLLDIDIIQLYESSIYPMFGESCYKYFRPCKYLNVCQLSTEHIAKPMDESQIDTTEYQVTLSLAELIDTQFKKAST